MNLMDLFVKISVDDQASSQVETIGSKLKGVAHREDECPRYGDRSGDSHFEWTVVEEH